MNIALDTDIGSDIDDTMALLLCLRLPELSVKAVTTVYGQVGIRAKIAKKLLDLAGVDIPVAVGESTPISSPMRIWHAGIEGQGILDEDEMRAPPSACGVLPDAVDLLARTARECEQDLDVVAIGPLTNLARAIQRDPEFRSNVRCIWAMIGGVTYPDRPPDRAFAPGEAFIARASHNVRCDVGAARIILESGIPVVMVGNDVTTRCRIDLPGIDKIKQHGGDVDQAVVRMMRTWLQYRSELFGRPVTWTCLHDALVVAEAY
ncbi:nucleoside hydrolase, partial [Candidatus Bipolaricaulota bacterium]|nr:nucleoside hydrolase [Candidatus Bipolaricaulota bacterium]